MCILLWVVMPAFSIMSWNVENWFDNRDDGTGASDREFSSQGDRHWTRKRLDRKTSMIAKTILWCDAPSVIGFEEVENSRVLRNLVYSDPLRKIPYRIVHYDSPDPRGIDVALIYDSDSLSLLKSYPLPVFRGSGGSRTRDILYVCLQDRKGLVWHFFVNHHPSKYSGASSSEGRNAAMTVLRRSVDSLLACGQTRIVAMGDFNDTPSAESFRMMEGVMTNAGRLPDMAGEGSIRYRGQWELIDNFLLSPALDGHFGIRVVKAPFLLERDRSFPGLKPKRTYIGPRYNGGVSDHLPLLLEFR